VDVFELDDLVTDTVERLGSRLAGHRVEVDVAPVPVLVDPVFLDEALTNLLDNALKFTPSDSVVRVRSIDPNGALARLVVDDSGPGVPPDHIGRIFEKFYRAPAPRARSRPGTGIGLAVVRGLVEAMGGTATAHRGDLGGLAVEIELPLAELPAGIAGAVGA
jgi:signal transduction histidine kinase